ncbi:divalent-cation tolerance protein CutA [Picosynechococcus sp. PCC 73109]|uniref:divalent-cation tolerance protein CutA n=1 Tax=Picosynechococcus sp. PCC 73109 TaxID=374982 RepID=UPI00074593BE|nr:divalent-cation tolerance protein CutA [Picosynechococcus sp. PCC 73109]AMA10044.1 cytochrome C biogenesis protein [Picosynechococcus sp. PCC 73109]
MQYLMAVTTVSSRQEAQAIAKQIMDLRLAACIHISEVESFYYWEGQLQQEPEFRLLFKTTAAQYAALEQAIKAHHPYELPAIYAIALDQVETAYGHWIDASVTSEHA